MTRPRVYYFNGSFDLRLGGGIAPRHERLFAEMTLWFMPVGTPADRIICDVSPPAEYLEYLDTVGLSPPGQTASGKRYPDHAGFPWGWDLDAVTRLRACGTRVDCPDLAVVKHVNMREFSIRVARECGLGVAGAVVCHSPKQARSAIRAAPNMPCVIKPAFGNAGIGFVFVESREPQAERFARVERLFERGDPAVVVEPWLPRTGDISTSFELGRDGTVSGLRHHLTRTTPQGGFYGVVLRPTDALVEHWRPELEHAAACAASALSAQGYFGPANVDSMVIDGSEGERLVALLEINARQGMSVIAYSLRERLCPDRYVLFRTVGRKQHSLPGSYAEWLEMLGELAYDPDRREGVICATPLRFEEQNTTVRPHRTMLFLAAQSEQRLWEIDDRLTGMLRGW